MKINIVCKLTTIMEALTKYPPCYSSSFIFIYVDNDMHCYWLTYTMGNPYNQEFNIFGSSQLSESERIYVLDDDDDDDDE